MDGSPQEFTIQWCKDNPEAAARVCNALARQMQNQTTAARLAGKIEGMEWAAVFCENVQEPQIAEAIRVGIAELQASPETGADRVMKSAGLAIDFTTGSMKEVKE